MLKIYRASAGSGKTYKLALEYLKLLFASPADDAYRRILAVTFTNKATAEMKRRIVSRLFVLAHDAEHSEYFGDLLSETGLSPEELQKKASDVLYSLLHDYSFFNIDTIDRFFQQTTRAFTREIGLQGGYNLELDNNRILSEAVDRMLFELDDARNRDLLQWLLRFSEEKVENAESWNIRGDIETLSGEIFKESYKRYGDELRAVMEDKKALREYMKELAALRFLFEKTLKEVGDSALEVMHRNNLSPTDFKRKNTSPFRHFESWAAGIVKEPTATFMKLLQSVDEWYTRNDDPEIISCIRNAADDGLIQCVQNAVECFGWYPEYLTAIETSRYFYTLGILSDIDRHVREYEQEHNLLLLSDTTELLHRIIDGSDTPFVYEKIGTRIDNLMIDEFQDTSNMQWANFEPLFRDSLDRGNSNLIVGDVKQSIYRWRNSDWKLLSEGLNGSFDERQRTDDFLDTNWRSSAEIINFNNSIFSQSAVILQNTLNERIEEVAVSAGIDKSYRHKIIDAYEDICQHISPVNKDYHGHVELQFIDNDDDEIPWKQRVLDAIPTRLMSLQDQGIQLKDIVFLVRVKKEGQMIADKLLQCKAENTDPRYRYDIISDEALYLGNAPVVKLIIGVLRFLQMPDSDLNKALAAYELNAARPGVTSSEALVSCFATIPGESLLDFLCDEEETLSSIRTLPLFELCEKIISKCSVRTEGDDVYVQAFQDMMLSYIDKHSADLASFLQWWDEWGKKKTISTPESQNAIRIMTIHQSKGLEFKAVLIPFCDWSIDNDSKHTHILWCRPGKPPFNRLPLVPVRYDTRLGKTIYAGDYFREKMQSYIDNLNLAYVAFTRAKEELLLFTPLPKNENNINSVSGLLYRCVTRAFDKETVHDCVDLTAGFDPETKRYELGLPHLTAPDKETEVEEMGMPVYKSYDFRERLQLRLYGKGYFGDRQERSYGTLMHEILSTIRYVADLDDALVPYILSGQVGKEQAGMLKSKIVAWISTPEVVSWFSPDVKVLNEVEILRSDGIFYRPDRVVIDNGKTDVIDYKFGNVERESYKIQVSRYVSLIRGMGFSEVRGYIWYVEMNKIIQV